MEKPNIDELRLRLEEVRARNDYDDRHACCWQGYIAALLEWDLITPNEHKELAQIVPAEKPDPALVVFLG